jgi:uncharacterized membrane protein (TIGR02234 family)
MTPRRQHVSALLGLAAGGVLALGVAQPDWVRMTGEAAAGQATGSSVVVSVGLPGSSVAVWVVPLALVSLAGALGVLASRGRARQVVGVVLLLAGLGIVADSLVVLEDPTSAAVSATAGTAQALDASGVRVSTEAGWPVVAAVGGVVVAAAAVAVVLRGRGWAAMAARYDAPGETAPLRAPADPWAALDRGEDPTAPGANLPE